LRTDKRSDAKYTANKGGKSDEIKRMPNLRNGKEKGRQSSGKTQSTELPVRPAVTASTESRDLIISTRFQAPQATARTVDSTGVPIRPKLLKRFYEALALLFVLGQNRGDPADEDDPEIEPDPTELDDAKLRRSFIRHLAYLCDYEAGGDTTCAIALEQTPQGIIYHVASNKSPSTEQGAGDKILNFLQNALNTVKASKPDELSTTEALLFSKSIKHSSARISRYSNLLDIELNYLLTHRTNANIDSGK
jgi:hypothetical protein